MLILPEHGHIRRVVTARQRIEQAVCEVVERVVVLALVERLEIVCQTQCVKTEQPVIRRQAKFLAERSPRAFVD